MSNSAVMALNPLSWCEVVFRVVKNNLAIVSTDSTDLIIWRELDDLDRFSLRVSVFAGLDGLEANATIIFHLDVKGLECAVDHTDSDDVSTVRDCHCVAWAFELGVDFLSPGWHVPDRKHAISSVCDHFGSGGMHGKAPELAFEVTSHVDIRLFLSVKFYDFAASCSYEDFVSRAEADAGSFRLCR